MERIIEARNITAYRGETRVFDGLSLEIAQGCNTAILGPNGSGKTTLLKLISREIHPVVQEESRLRIFGRELYNVWELRGRLGIVSHDLQSSYLEGARGINVLLSGYYSGNGTSSHMRFSEEQRRSALRTMERLEVGHLADRRFGTMSTGQQRRCLLGRALVHDPDALLLDEPTEGLAVKASFQYFDIVRRLIAEGKTLILVTHHIHEILPEVERVVLLKDGAIAGDGRKSEVLSSPVLSELFDYALEVGRHNGFYQVVPAGGTSSYSPL